jgi:hypothetical protein
VGHVGFFRKRFEKSFWPLLIEIIEKEETHTRANTCDSKPSNRNQSTGKPVVDFIDPIFLNN